MDEKELKKQLLEIMASKDPNEFVSTEQSVIYSYIIYTNQKYSRAHLKPLTIDDLNKISDKDKKKLRNYNFKNSAKFKKLRKEHEKTQKEIQVARSLLGEERTNYDSIGSLDEYVNSDMTWDEYVNKKSSEIKKQNKKQIHM